jgi:hypothetical protein
MEKKRQIYIIGENHLYQSITQKKLLILFSINKENPQIFTESTDGISYYVNLSTKEKIVSKTIPKTPSTIEAIFHILTYFIALKNEPTNILQGTNDKGLTYSYTPEIAIHKLMKRFIDIDITPKYIVKRPENTFLRCKEKLIELCMEINNSITQIIITEIEKITYLNIDYSNLRPIMFESYKLVDEYIINNIISNDIICNKDDIFYIIVGNDHVLNIREQINNLTDKKYIVKII